MMSGHGTTQGKAGESADPLRARVVLVGRTGLDAKLRLDLDLELIRSRTALEAIGELGNPVGGPAERTFVIVGHDADIGGRVRRRGPPRGAWCPGARLGRSEPSGD